MIASFSISSLLVAALFLITTSPMYDFGKKTGGKDWYTLNDDVMGGRSEAKLKIKREYLTFEGQISLENNGGFASIRSPYGEFDLSEYKSVHVRYKSYENDFAFVLENKEVYYEPTYKHHLPASNGEWTVAILHLDEFEGYRLGKKIGEKLTAEIQSNMIRMGIITDTKKEDKFKIAIDYIEFSK